MSPRPALKWMSAILIIIIFNFSNCQATCLYRANPCNPNTDYFKFKPSIKFANRTISPLTFSNTYVDFTVFSRGPTYKYRLVKCGCPVGDIENDRQVIFTNPKAVYISEGPILGLFQPVIPDLNPLRYILQAQFIFSPAIRQRVQDGLTQQLSNGSFIDYQRLQDDPDVGASLIGEFSISQYEAAMIDVPFLAFTEVLETTPLGRAEWIKIIGLLFEQSRKAEHLFNFVVRRYNKVKYIASTASERPSVFFNTPFGNTWSQPAGLQYISAYARDAHANYKFSYDGQENTLQLNFSEIAGNFSETEFLVNAGGFPVSNTTTLETFIWDATKPQKRLYRKLQSFRCGNVWGNQRRVSPNNMASDFFELGAYRADLLLTDYVKIFHPKLLRKQPFTFLYSFGTAKVEKVGGPCNLEGFKSE